MNTMKYSYKPNYFFFAHKLVFIFKGLSHQASDGAANNV